MRENFKIYLAAAGSYRALQKKIAPLYQEKVAVSTARNLKLLMNNLSISQFQFFYY